MAYPLPVRAARPSLAHRRRAAPRPCGCHDATLAATRWPLQCTASTASPAPLRTSKAPPCVGCSTAEADVAARRDRELPARAAPLLEQRAAALLRVVHEHLRHRLEPVGDAREQPEHAREVVAAVLREQRAVEGQTGRDAREQQRRARRAARQRGGAGGKLLPEMILVCNNLRNDLSHPNEYIRGCTLRFICKLKEAEILEPLIPTIKNCLEHRHPFVRRNAVLAVFAIFKSFDYLLPDGPELVEQVLATETMKLGLHQMSRLSSMDSKLDDIVLKLPNRRF